LTKPCGNLHWPSLSIGKILIGRLHHDRRCGMAQTIDRAKAVGWRSEWRSQDMRLLGGLGGSRKGSEVLPKPTPVRCQVVFLRNDMTTTLTLLSCQSALSHHRDQVKVSSAEPSGLAAKHEAMRTPSRSHRSCICVVPEATYLRCDRISVQVHENRHGVDGNDLPAAILVQARRTGLDEVEI